MSEEDRFCTACGARLPTESIYCPECGRPVAGGENPHAGGQAYDRGVRPEKSAIPMFILMYGIFGLIMGISVLSMGAMMTESWYNDMLRQVVDTMGQSYADIMPAWSEWMRTSMIIAGVFGILSPMAALVSYYFCWKGGPWNMAFYGCIASTVLTLGICVGDLTGILLFIIGAIVTYLLHRDRDKVCPGAA